MSAAQIAKLAKKLKISTKKAKQLIEERKNKSSKATTDRMFSSQTGAGRGKFEKGGPPAPKIEKAKDTPFDRDLDVKVIVGREGKSERAGKINIGDDVVGFTNFIKMQQSKSGLSISKYREKLNQITRSKEATR